MAAWTFDRGRQPSKSYNTREYILLKNAGQPKNYHKVEDNDKKEWLSTMENEKDSLKKSHTYDLVKLLNSKRAPKNRRVLGTKREENGAKSRYKAWLVIKVFKQRKGVTSRKYSR